MAHVSNTGTISVNPSSVLALGGTVTFTVTFSPSNLDSKFSRNGGVQIILEASRPVTSGPPGDVTYRDTKHYDQPFVLGQGGENTGTAWRDVGGPMHMRADLFYWDYHDTQQPFTYLATVEFEAAG